MSFHFWTNTFLKAIKYLYQSQVFSKQTEQTQTNEIIHLLCCMLLY